MTPRRRETRPDHQLTRGIRLLGEEKLGAQGEGIQSPDINSVLAVMLQQSASKGSHVIDVTRLQNERATRVECFCNRVMSDGIVS